MGYPGSIFYDHHSYVERGLNFLRDCLTQPDELPDWRVLVLIENQRISGYLLFVLDDEHGVTHQLQALIVDYAVFSFDGLSKLIARARKTVSAFENEYLLVELPPANSEPSSGSIAAVSGPSRRA